MSEETSRKIGGLRPRHQGQGLDRLIKANRDEQAAPEGEQSRDSKSSARETQLPPAAPAPLKASRTVKGTGSKTTVTVYLDNILRGRSRAAFTATRHLEHDSSYSEMIAKAIDDEVTRREIKYNEGRPFDGGGTDLPTGRPLS